MASGPRFSTLAIGEGADLTLRFNFGVYPPSKPAASRGAGSKPATSHGAGTSQPGDIVHVTLLLTGGFAGDLVSVRLLPAAGAPGTSAPAQLKATAPKAPTATPAAPPTFGGVDDADGGPKSRVQLRLEREGARLGLSLTFKRVPGEYYEQSLEWRADVLGAPSVEHLCKSIIMENTRFDVGETKLTPVVNGRVKYVLVVVQYTQRLKTERLIDAVRTIEGDKAIGKAKV
ncbi:hypothetical protein T492DRAFT_892748, partial [Pavlovales sp. CCMP2436]